MQQWFLLQILLLAQHVSGITMPIIRSSRVLYSGCCLWYFVLWFSSCWSGVELMVMCPVCRMLQQIFATIKVPTLIYIYTTTPKSLVEYSWSLMLEIVASFCTGSKWTNIMFTFCETCILFHTHLKANICLPIIPHLKDIKVLAEFELNWKYACLLKCRLNIYSWLQFATL